MNEYSGTAVLSFSFLTPVYMCLCVCVSVSVCMGVAGWGGVGWWSRYRTSYRHSIEHKKIEYLAPR